MNSSVFLSNFENTLRHLYGWVLRGVLRYRDNRCIDSSRLNLGDRLSAVLPRTVSATASTGGRFAIAVSSSVATTRSALTVFASSMCLFKTPAITVALRVFAVNTADARHYIEQGLHA
jgi:hypothetical protein